MSSENHSHCHCLISIVIAKESAERSQDRDQEPLCLALQLSERGCRTAPWLHWFTWMIWTICYISDNFIPMFQGQRGSWISRLHGAWCLRATSNGRVRCPNNGCRISGSRSLGVTWLLVHCVFESQWPLSDSRVRLFGAEHWLRSRSGRSWLPLWVGEQRRCQRPLTLGLQWFALSISIMLPYWSNLTWFWRSPQDDRNRFQSPADLMFHCRETACHTLQFLMPSVPNHLTLGLHWLQVTIQCHPVSNVRWSNDSNWQKGEQILMTLVVATLVAFIHGQCDPWLERNLNTCMPCELNG